MISGPPVAEASRSIDDVEEPASCYWFSDREIGGRRQSPIGYTTQELRTELARVERKMYRLTIVSMVVAGVALFAIVGLLFQALQ